MIISSIVIDNFRCYYGENILNFNNDGKTILIYGKSGYGKSTLIQFLRWMFYNDAEFGNNDDKPVFNELKFKESKLGEQIIVKGKIDFIHLGVKYSLIKNVYYDYALNPDQCFMSKMEYYLQHLVNDSWIRYQGNISEKISSIMPKELSKYFFLEGEKAREVVLNSVDLKKAIYRLFQLEAYEKAIYHIGNRGNKRSVLGIIETEKASKITNIGQDVTAFQLQSAIQGMWEKVNYLDNSIRNEKGNLKKYEKEIDNLLTLIGTSTNKETIIELIKSNTELIDEKHKKINSIVQDISKLFYSNYPYLFLANITNNATVILKEQSKVFENDHKNIFEHLRRELLDEILEKNKCVCDRCLDKESKEKINGLLGVMPPKTYSYQLGQFISLAKKRIQISGNEISKYNEKMNEIAQIYIEISDIEKDNNKLIEQFEKINSSKSLVDKLSNTRAKKESCEEEIRKMIEERGEKNSRLNVFKKKYDDLTNNNQVTKIYDSKIKFFMTILESLIEDRNNTESKIKLVLNQCITDVFKKLTTQTDINPDKIKFIKNDFSLREAYLTGGQLAIDVYSYVVGILKALQDCDVESSENPFIIDAPFAFTDNIQSEHIFNTLPEVSKQTILLTLDLNKIKNCLKDKNKFEFYIIDNKTQNKAVIRKGDINDIK